MTNLLQQAAKAAGMKYMSGPQDFWLDDRAYDIEDPALLPLIASRLRAQCAQRFSMWHYLTEALRVFLGLAEPFPCDPWRFAQDRHMVAAAMQSLGKWTEAQAREFVEAMK